MTKSKNRLRLEFNKTPLQKQPNQFFPLFFFMKCSRNVKTGLQHNKDDFLTWHEIYNLKFYEGFKKKSDSY